MIKIGKVHGSIQIIKIIDGEPHIADDPKGKFKWVPTIMEPRRLKTFKPICEIGLVMKLMDLEREKKILK